jgi:PAS domain S-box-containing protein
MDPAPHALVHIDAALARSGDGGFATGPHGRILAWNRAAERICGFSAREVIGKGCCDVFCGYDDAGNRLCYPGCHIQSLVQMAEPVSSYDMRVRTKAGTPVWVNVSVLPLSLDGASAPVTLHLFRDVTATKELLSLVQARQAGGHNGASNGAAAPSLTRRELEILRLLADGLDTAAAAERLHVSRATVRNHVQNIFAKLGVHSRLGAVAYATKHRLL